MIRTRRETKPTFLQKGFMCIIAVISLGSFFMVILQSANIISSDEQIFTHILFSSLSAMFGFLLGNNVRTVF